MKALLDACDQSAGNSALILAAKNGFADTCRVLLDAGANVHATNRKRESALDLAAAAGYRKVVDPCVLMREMTGRGAACAGERAHDVSSPSPVGAPILRECSVC